MNMFKFGTSIYYKEHMDELEDHFNWIEDDGCEKTLCSRTFTHEEDDFQFDYCYVIHTYMADKVVCFLSLCVVTGYENVADAYYNGFPIVFERAMLPGDIDGPDVLQWMEYAANAYTSIDRIRGFYLDRPANNFGFTGWDFIDFALGRKTMEDKLKEITNGA